MCSDDFNIQYNGATMSMSNEGAGQWTDVVVVQNWAEYDLKSRGVTDILLPCHVCKGTTISDGPASNISLFYFNQDNPKTVEIKPTCFF